MKKKIKKYQNISIGFSCYNEKKYIIKNIKKIMPILKKAKLKYEIIVIDDASQETGIRDLRNFCKQNDVKYIRHHKNLGFYSSFKTGILNAKYEYFKLFAGDDATRIKDIKKILREFNDRDILIPFNHQFEVSGKPKFRMLISIIYTTVVNLVSGLNLKYYNGLPVYKKNKALMNLADTSGYGWQAELLVNCIYSGCTFKEIYTKNKEIKFRYNSVRLKYIPSVFFSIIRIFFKKISTGLEKKICYD